MLGRPRRRDAEFFIDHWAPDLAALVQEAWPHLRYVGPRVIDAHPGLLLTAATGTDARFDAPLNAFLYLSDDALNAFCEDDLISYARFNAALRWLDRYCLPYDVDLRGGSQREPLTRMVSIASLVDPKAA